MEVPVGKLDSTSDRGMETVVQQNWGSAIKHNDGLLLSSVSRLELQDGLEKGSIDCGLDGSGVDNSASDEPTERSVLDVFDSINSFAILQDPAEFDVRGLDVVPLLSYHAILVLMQDYFEDLVLVEMDSGLEQSGHESSSLRVWMISHP
ncbi:hypothetical protein Nepgr_027197 [Nepenthes gracilis]|uniref:Uncharacterized protein n=1 Tax=Nepenthes gracilis TaxID=150966 RepID=A0AAD3TAD8_NEPGR|nr:hypothetical protein Nepgr_027197 [Nepenthes gracilis]